MAVNRMITNGWLEEVDANIRKGEPLWRETGDGHGTTLIATEAGLEAIGVEPMAASAVVSARKRKPQMEASDAPKPVTIRAGTKQAQIIALLQRPEGASIAEIVEATGWQPHSVRSAISRLHKKNDALTLVSESDGTRGHIYLGLIR